MGALFCCSAAFHSSWMTQTAVHTIPVTAARAAMTIIIFFM